MSDTNISLKRTLGLWDIVLLNVVAIVGLRWILLAAQTGAYSIFLWIMAFVLFFLPISFAVVELSTRYPEEGGIYPWTKRAMGPFHGFMAGWTYWVNNLIYYPGLLIFVAGNAVFIFGNDPTGLAESNVYILIFSLGGLWLALFLNIIGLKFGRWVHNVGGAGTWAVAAILIITAFILALREGSATSFKGNMLPDFSDFHTISFWATICFAFAGIELSSLLTGEIKEPRKVIPRAIVFSGAIISAIYILGTVALLLIFPKENINIISGIPAVLSQIGDRLGLPFLAVLGALGITLGGLGGVGTWLSATARIPFVIGIDEYFPKSFARIHPVWGTPYIAILWQGLLSSAFILMAVAGSSIEEAYNVLVSATVIVYFIPYLYLFISLGILKDREKPTTETIPVPGKKPGMVFTIVAGLFTTGLSIVLALSPPGGTKHPVLFVFKVLSGTLFFILVGVLVYWTGSKKTQEKSKRL